jgi:large subunit ribosomal protein L5
VKISLNMGVGKALQDKERMKKSAEQLGLIAGQKPQIMKAKVAVSGFRLREGNEIGCRVTLRGKRMYEFLDRLISLTIPRVKDFRGLPPDGFDKAGNYNFGFTEQTVFAEVDSASVTFQQGMNLTLCTTAGSADRGRDLLKQFGFPFREDNKKD